MNTQVRTPSRHAGQGKTHTESWAISIPYSGLGAPETSTAQVARQRCPPCGNYNEGATGFIFMISDGEMRPKPQLVRSASNHILEEATHPEVQALVDQSRAQPAAVPCLGEDKRDALNGKVRHGSERIEGNGRMGNY